jgi:hypothetical protein
MSDRCVQKEEIEALEAIYGDAVAQVSHSDAEAVTITLSDGDVRLGELKVMFPGDYPSSMCPVFEIRSGLCSGPDEMREVSEQLTALFVPGEVVVYQCVEWLKDHLLEKSAKSSKEEGPCCCVDKVSRSASRFEEDKDEPSSPDSSSHLQSSILTGEKMVEEVAISDISHGEPLTDRKSTFQAHVAEVHSREEVLLILKKLKENRKITVATHNILAYRIYDSQKHVYIHDCDDDGESAAGSRLLHLLEVCAYVFYRKHRK